MSNCSLTYEYIIKPSCTQLVPYVPSSVSPNMITIFGGVCCVVTCMCMSLAKEYSIFYIGAFVFFMMYVLCDNMDGIVARERKQCSELGKVLDHFVDGTSALAATAMITHRFIGNRLNGWEHLLWILPITGVTIYHLHDSIMTRVSAQIPVPVPVSETAGSTPNTLKSQALVGVEDVTLSFGVAPLMFFYFPDLIEKYQLPLTVLCIACGLLCVAGLVDDIRKNLDKTSANDRLKYTAILVLYVSTCYCFVANLDFKFVSYMILLCVLLAINR